MKATINISDPTDQIQIIVRYDTNTNNVHQATFYYEDVAQFIIYSDLSMDMCVPDHFNNISSIPHINACVDMFNYHNNPLTSGVAPSKQIFGMLLSKQLQQYMQEHSVQAVQTPTEYRYFSASPMDNIKPEANFYGVHNEHNH